VEVEKALYQVLDMLGMRYSSTDESYYRTEHYGSRLLNAIDTDLTSLIGKFKAVLEDEEMSDRRVQALLDTFALNDETKIPALELVALYLFWMEKGLEVLFMFIQTQRCYKSGHVLQKSELFNTVLGEYGLDASAFMQWHKTLVEIFTPRCVILRRQSVCFIC
jgi:hypothetical protein